MANEKIEIEIVLDDGTVKKGFAKIAKQSKKTGAKVSKNLEIGKKAVGGFLKLTAVAGVAAIAVAAVFTRKGVQLAAAQDQAVRNLNTTLANAGEFSKEASQNLQEFASALQQSTGVGDEVILQQIALATAFGFTGDQLKVATQAALDLSVAAGINLEEATRRIGRSISGSIDDVSKFAPEIKNLTKEQLAAGEAANALARALSGTAAGAAQTFTGSTAKLSSSFGDFQEQIGKFITQSPAVRTAITAVAKLFSDLGDSLGKDNGDFAKNFIIQFSIILQAGIRSADGIADGFVLAALRAQQAWQAFRVLTTIGLGDATNQALFDTNEQIDAILNKDYEDNPAIKFFDGLIEKVTATNGALTAFGEGVTVNQERLTEALPTFKEGIESFTSAFEQIEMKLPATQKQIAETRKVIKKDFKAMGDSARDGLARGAGSAFATFGKALATGENALGAFVDALIGAIGQQAIATGTEMILRGVGYSLDPLYASFGPPLIGAGAALATFGGVLSAVGGGAGGGASGGGGGGVGAAGVDPIGGELGTNVEELDAEPVTKVQIDVSGQVLGNELEIGNQIADVLNKSFQAGGTKVEVA